MVRKGFGGGDARACGARGRAAQELMDRRQPWPADVRLALAALRRGMRDPGARGDAAAAKVLAWYAAMRPAAGAKGGGSDPLARVRAEIRGRGEEPSSSGGMGGAGGSAEPVGEASQRTEGRVGDAAGAG